MKIKPQKFFRRKISVNISCFICIVGCREHGERFGGKEAQGYISSPMNSCYHTRAILFIIIHWQKCISGCR